MQRQFDVLPSRRLAATLVLAYSVAMLALLPLGLPTWALITLYLLLLFSLWLHWRQVAYLSSPSSVVKLKLEGEVLELTLRNNQQRTEQLLPSSFVSPFLTILNLRRDSYLPRSVIILPDSMDREAFRQLRVGLKWNGEDKIQGGKT